ncbi:hypothetical protein JOL62DRAFT_414207 [Phyllosticta paracitricarpa]|uniref:Uncharacterized protein n=1 Tax=Phyllosticta paracitricarpa TaxID=2016321 RepID=A0ABR1MRZ3_9PEZI
MATTGDGGPGTSAGGRTSRRGGDSGTVSTTSTSTGRGATARATAGGATASRSVGSLTCSGHGLISIAIVATALVVIVPVFFFFFLFFLLFFFFFVGPLTLLVGLESLADQDVEGAHVLAVNTLQKLDDGNRIGNLGRLDVIFFFQELQGKFMEVRARAVGGALSAAPVDKVGDLARVDEGIQDVGQKGLLGVAVHEGPLPIIGAGQRSHAGPGPVRVAAALGWPVDHDFGELIEHLDDRVELARHDGHVVVVDLFRKAQQGGIRRVQPLDGLIDSRQAQDNVIDGLHSSRGLVASASGAGGGGLGGTGSSTSRRGLSGDLGARSAGRGQQRGINGTGHCGCHQSVSTVDSRSSGWSVDLHRKCMRDSGLVVEKSLDGGDLEAKS